MLSAGKKITDAADRLSRITTEYLVERIRHPQADIESRIKSLRLVYGLDKKRYGQLKRELPYVVCAAFNPEFRNIQNFAFTDSFIVDIDHISSLSLNVLALKSQLSTDPRVAVAFISPSGDGIKVMFNLSEKCYDPGVFSAFYKTFVKQFALQYGLTEAVDIRTSDVSRACFISFDPDAYYNPKAETVDLLLGAESQTDTLSECAVSESEEGYHGSIQPDKKAANEGKDKAESELNTADPDSEIMARIKQQLKLSQARERATREFYVPNEIETVMVGLREVICETGVTINEERNIQYGKQLVMSSNLRKAELNIFFGRRGFSVVESTRRGTSAELNGMMAQLVRSHLATLIA